MSEPRPTPRTDAEITKQRLSGRTTLSLSDFARQLERELWEKEGALAEAQGYSAGIKLQYNLLLSERDQLQSQVQRLREALKRLQEPKVSSCQSNPHYNPGFIINQALSNTTDFSSKFVSREVLEELYCEAKKNQRVVDSRVFDDALALARAELERTK